jgi:hypothetical protein
MDMFIEHWERYLKEERKKKPDCKPGAKWHDSDGRFSKKEDATSWGGGYGKEGKKDCTSGKYATDGSGKKKITKHKCGRREDGGKHPFKCKDGERAYQEGIQTEDMERSDREYLRAIITQELKTALQQHMKSSGCSFNELIRALNLWSVAEKGQVNSKKK